MVASVWVVMSTVRATIEIEPLLALFGSGHPNPTHRFLARLLPSGLVHTLYTTNFDTLLESALEQSGFVRGIDYKVYASDHEDAALGTATRRLPSILKLHGSVDEP